MFEFHTEFEEFPLSRLTGLVGDAGYADGYIVVSATKHDWELADVFVYVGPRGNICEKAPKALADAIRDFCMSRPGWVGLVDQEHAAYYSPDAIADRRSYVPAWMEPV